MESLIVGIVNHGSQQSKRVERKEGRLLRGQRSNQSSYAASSLRLPDIGTIGDHSNFKALHRNAENLAAAEVARSKTPNPYRGREKFPKDALP
jgi:hypothetical protein